MRRSVLVLLVIVGMLLAGCGPAMVPAAAPETATGEVFVIGLPRIVLAVDAQGKIGLEGFPIDDILSVVGMANPLSGFAIDPFYPTWMTNANIQHIELRTTGAGVALLANGIPMPHVAWNDESLQQTADLAPLFLLQAEMVKKFIPVISRMGLSVAVKFPLKEGAEAIPFASDEVALAAAAPEEGPASAVVQFEIKYDEAGVPSILGISAQDLAALGIQAPLALAPQYLDLMKANNIQNMQLHHQGDGLYVYINGTPLPNVVWDKNMLGAAVDVFAQLYPTLPADQVGLIKEFVPMLTSADVAVMVHFPLASGAEPIPAKMQ